MIIVWVTIMDNGHIDAKHIGCRFFCRPIRPISFSRDLAVVSPTVQWYIPYSLLLCIYCIHKWLFPRHNHSVFYPFCIYCVYGQVRIFTTCVVLLHEYDNSWLVWSINNCSSQIGGNYLLNFENIFKSSGVGSSLDHFLLTRKYFVNNVIIGVGLLDDASTIFFTWDSTYVRVSAIFHAHTLIHIWV